MKIRLNKPYKPTWVHECKQYSSFLLDTFHFVTDRAIMTTLNNVYCFVLCSTSYLLQCWMYSTFDYNNLVFLPSNSLKGEFTIMLVWGLVTNRMWNPQGKWSNILTRGMPVSLVLLTAACRSSRVSKPYLQIDGVMESKVTEGHHLGLYLTDYSLLGCSSSVGSVTNYNAGGLCSVLLWSVGFWGVNGQPLGPPSLNGYLVNHD